MCSYAMSIAIAMAKVKGDGYGDGYNDGDGKDNNAGNDDGGDHISVLCPATKELKVGKYWYYWSSSREQRFLTIHFDSSKATFWANV